MCNALSPERAVLWACLYERELFERVAARLTPGHFTHPPYRHGFAAAARLYRSGQTHLSEAALRGALEAEGGAVSEPDFRALARMLRNEPWPRIRNHLEIYAQALESRAQATPDSGRRIALAGLIN